MFSLDLNFVYYIIYLLFSFYYVPFYVTFIVLLNVFKNITYYHNVNLIGYYISCHVFYNVEFA